jgi:hypothetical protein
MRKKTNAIPNKCSTHIIKLERSKVKVIGELKDVLIRISSNPKFHKVIYIVVVNILEEYGLFHNRDWSEKLQ